MTDPSPTIQQPCSLSVRTFHESTKHGIMGDGVPHSVTPTRPRCARERPMVRLIISLLRSLDAKDTLRLLPSQLNDPFWR